MGFAHPIQVEELRSGFVEVFVASLADLASEVELFVSEAATVETTVEGAGSGWKTHGKHHGRCWKTHGKPWKMP